MLDWKKNWNKDFALFATLDFPEIFNPPFCIIFTRWTIHRQFQIFTRHCAQNNPDRFKTSEDAIMRKGRRTFQNLLGEFSNPTGPRSSLFCEEHATMAKSSRWEGGGKGVGWNVLSWRKAGVSSRPIPLSRLAVSPVLCNREWGFQTSVFRRESPFHSHWQSDVTSHLRATTRWSLFCWVMVDVEDALNR